MDDLVSILPNLTESQLIALTAVAREMAHPGSADMLTVNQMHEVSGLSESTIRAAMRDGRLPYTTPHGQTRPRYAKREDFEAWLGK